MTSHDFMNKAFAFVAEAEKNNLYLRNIGPHSFNIEQIVRPPEPMVKRGLGIYGSVQFDAWVSGIQLNWGPCTIDSDCYPNHAPFTSDQGVGWNYWQNYDTITPEDEAVVRVAFADLFVRLRELYGAVAIASDRLRVWHDERMRKNQKVVTTTWHQQYVVLGTDTSTPQF